MIRDRYRHLRNSTYICNECGDIFTHWQVHDDDWVASGFDWKVVCKPCFEKRVPSPRYMTLEEYEQYSNEPGRFFNYGIEEKNRIIDNCKRRTARKSGVKGLKSLNEHLNKPYRITEPERRKTWVCEYCHTSIETYDDNKPPEICLTCGR